MRRSAGHPLIWIIDSEHWPRAFLRAELIERGYDAVGYADLKSALTALPLARAKPSALVLELCGLGTTQEQLQQLAASTIPVIILGGMVELNEPFKNGPVWAAVLRRPTSIGEIADRVEKVIPRGSGSRKSFYMF